MVTPTDAITIMLAPENTPALQTIPMIMVWTAVPQLGMELLPDQRQAYWEGQQA
jgi:hypothetical protein